MWRQTSKNFLCTSAEPVSTRSGDVESPRVFQWQHTGQQPPQTDVLKALQVVVKRIDALPPQMVFSERRVMDDNFKGKLLRVMDCLKELNCRASAPQQAKLVHIAQTLIAMETYFAARLKDNSMLIGMLKSLRPECDNPPKVPDGADTTKYDAVSHMQMIKLCFDQLLDVSSMKNSSVCDKFAFPLFAVGEFNFAEEATMKLLADDLRKEGYDGWDEKIDSFYERFLEMTKNIYSLIKNKEGAQPKSDSPGGDQNDAQSSDMQNPNPPPDVSTPLRPPPHRRARAAPARQRDEAHDAQQSQHELVAALLSNKNSLYTTQKKKMRTMVD